MPTYTNSTGLTFVDNGTVSQTIAVSGFTSTTINNVRLTITGLTDEFPEGLDFLLVGPDGVHNLVFWSDAGGGGDLAGATFTIADSGAAPLDDSAQLLSGTTYQPADHPAIEADSNFGSATGGLNHATPVGTATFATAFNGIDPNGTWTLYASDDTPGLATGSLASWTLSFNTAIDLVIVGTAGSDTAVVTATGPDSGTVSVNGGAAIPFSGVTSLTFDGPGGDDKLTIINPDDGMFTVPVFYAGGGQPDDTLEILGGTASATTYTAAGASSGIISTQVQGGNTAAINFTGLSQVTDTVTEDTFIIVGTAGADTITIIDGGLVNGDQTWLIDSPTFESVRVTNKATLIIDGNGGGDTLSMDTTVAMTGLQSLQIRGVAAVTETGSFQVASLTIDATNAITLANANNVDTFSAQVSAPNGAVQFRNTSNFTVAGITTDSGGVTLASDIGSITVGTSAANSGIDTGTTGADVLLQATTGNIAQLTNGAITASRIGVLAGGFVDLADAINDANVITIQANGTVNYHDADDVALGSTAAGGLFTSAVAGISSSNNDVNLQVGGALRLNDLIPTSAAIDAGTADIRILAGGNVDQINSTDAIIADELGILAGGVVRLAAGNNEINTLAVATTGLVEFRDSTSSLIIGTVTAGGLGFTGATGITSGNNDVNLRTQGTLTLNGDINAGTGDIRLVSDTGAMSEFSGRLVGDEVGIIAPVGVAATLNNDANTLAILASGTVAYHDVDDLVIGTVAAGGSAGFAGATGASGASVDVSTSSPLTVAGPVVANAGNVTLTAGDSAAAGDDLTVNSTTVIAASANVGLRAGDNLNLLAGSSVVAGGFVQSTIDFSNADAGVGGIANLNGTITAPGVHQFLGLADGDTFFSAAGADQFLGGAGNDRFVWDPGDGSDTIDGGADSDTLAFNGSAGDEVFALSPSGANAVFTRNVGGITMTMAAVERLELAAGNGTNLFTVGDMTAAGLTGLISYTGGTGTDTVNGATAVNPFNIAGGGGDDLLTGGLANDTAVYGGNLADYRIDFLGSDIRITDRRAEAPDGIDTLRGIENGAFANTTITFQPGTSGDDSFTASGSQAIGAGLGNDTFTFGFRLVDATVTYAGNSVLIESGATHTVASGFERFVFTDGTVDNNDGSPLIDDLFYYSQNHDVWNAQADADFHYNAVGFHEGRDPSAFFDTSLYLSAYFDVFVSGANPLAHFDTIGWKEARVPSLTFDPKQYLDANPDVAAAQIDPLWHFLAIGASEGRVPFDAAKLIAINGFDFVYYLQNNPDVAAAGVNPLQHFQTVGWTEGRNPNALFDTAGYLAAYTDVAAAHINPLDHYNLAGWLEGRDPSANFDTTAYLAANPDVAAAHVNPLVHFLHVGQDEGRLAIADGVFD